MQLRPNLKSESGSFRWPFWTKTARFGLALALTACTPQPPAATEVAPQEVLQPVLVVPQLSHAKVVGVIDGDTVDVLLPGNVQQRLRLNGIDAPERGRPFGNNAKLFLSDVIMAKDIQFEALDTDRYDRVIAEIYTGETRVTEALVAAGLAWHYIEYSSDPALADAENAARAKQLGLWSDPRFVAPWEWRKLSKDERDRLR